MAQNEFVDTEQPVIAAIRGGDRYAFCELVERHKAWVRGAVFAVLGDRDCVDDVTQQVWLSVWKRIGELRDDRSWRSWLYRLARNAAIDAGRELSRRKQRFQRLTGDPSSARIQTPSETPHRDEQHREVLAAVRSLPILYREPFVLRHLNGWSYREIAKVMDIPVDTIETRLVRARRILREALKGKV